MLVPFQSLWRLLGMFLMGFGLFRTLTSNQDIRLTTTQNVYLVLSSYENWGLFLFHIHYKKNEWLDKKNYEWLIRVNKRPFWKAKWAYKLHIFSRVKRVKKYATSKAIWPWKKAVYSQGSTIHSFECTKSFMNFRINVEHVCLLFVRL